MSDKCGKYAAPLLPFEYFPCVLDPGHEGDCRPGGVCVTHGPYVGEPGVPPVCPHPVEECARLIHAFEDSGKEKP